MKKLLLFAALFWTAGLAAQKDWTKLFNGKDLQGWTQRGGAAKYRVEKGEIIGETVAGTPNSFLCTEAEYGDFILELELKVDAGMNSGIQFRSLSKPDYQNGRVHGYQMEVDPSPRAWSGGIYDEGRRDWLYVPNLNPAGKKAFKPGDWNTYRIEAVGPVIRTWINGVPVAQLVDDMTPRGFIALQVHSIYGDMRPGMQIRWRNIRIQTKNLKTTAPDETPVVNLLPNNLSEQEKKQGFKLLFNGKNLEGWRVARSTEAPTRRWSVTEGELRVAKSDGSETGNDIVTTEQFSAFELVFEFKLSEGANSGVKYFVNENFDSGGKSGIGLEYQLLDDERHPDAKMGAAGNRTLASLYDLIPSEKLDKRFQRPIGAWNEGRIQVFPDNRVRYFLNGFKVLEYERKSLTFKALVARSKYEKFEGFGLNDAGPILLQDHGDAVAFRSVKIRLLTNSPERCD
jgi:hypothetical protein